MHFIIRGIRMEFVRKNRDREELKLNQEEEVVYFTFPKLEETGVVKHLFTTRLGGVSEGIFSSMNVSFTRGDKKECVMENYARLAKVLKGSLEDFVCSDQTHTTNIRRVTRKDSGKGVVFEKDYTEVDGLITNEEGLILSTFFADCVPLYFVDPVKKAIGLAHSGWRGTVGKIGKAMIGRMEEEFGTAKEDLVVAIGPSICQDCYEVSEDVAEVFLKEFGSVVLKPGKAEGKYQLDLWKANELVFLEAGLRKEQISITDICTCCNGELLFSHRYSNGKRGNLGAFMKLTTKEAKEKMV